MIGYIDDAIIGSQVRGRFDVGLSNRAPDRAEFFYAKCGCFADPALGELFDPNAPGPRPNAATELDFKQLMVEAEYAVGRISPCSASCRSAGSRRRRSSCRSPGSRARAV